MDTVPAVRHEARTGTRPEFDAVVIGAGVAGLYQLYRLREIGLRVRAFETGSAVGGTWYWNRYPGARFDSESWTYGYSFSKELLEEWEWEEHFSAQPHTERYLNYVADKFDLRCDIQFNSRVAAAHWRDHDLDAMIAALKQMEAEVAGGGLGIEGDAAFHHAIALAARNEILLHMIDAMADVIQESRIESLSEPGRPPRSLAAHRKILAAIEVRNAELAGEAMRQHLRVVADVSLLRWQPETSEDADVRQ